MLFGPLFYLESRLCAGGASVTHWWFYCLVSEETVDYLWRCLSKRRASLYLCWKKRRGASSVGYSPPWLIPRVNHAKPVFSTASSVVDWGDKWPEESFWLRFVQEASCGSGSCADNLGLAISIHSLGRSLLYVTHLPVQVLAYGLDLDCSRCHLWLQLRFLKQLTGHTHQKGYTFAFVLNKVK